MGSEMCIRDRITREAVLNFKKKHGLDADGTITTALLNELSKLTEL